MLGIDGLGAQLTEDPRVREALLVLVDDGLETQLGELVGVSCAGVCFQAFGSVSSALLVEPAHSVNAAVGT